MNPESVLEERDHMICLQRIVAAFADSLPTASTRRHVLINANLRHPLNLEGSAVDFAQGLSAWFLRTPVSANHADGHPLCVWARFLLQGGGANYGISNDDTPFLEAFIKEVRNRSYALAARRCVAMIEDATELGFATGVLVAPNLVLTCSHILTKRIVDRAWARFEFKKNFDGLSTSTGISYQIDLGRPVARGDGMMAPDFALLRLKDSPNRPPIKPRRLAVSANQAVCLIHHPGGRPAEVSPRGRVEHVDESYVLHDVATAEGSSGAPAFDSSWNLIAIQRGETPRTKPGVTEAVPLSAILAIPEVAKILGES